MTGLLVSIHEAADLEINEAADFYDFRSPGLGSIFIDEVERAMEIISRFPESSRLANGRLIPTHAPPSSRSALRDQIPHECSLE